MLCNTFEERGGTRNDTRECKTRRKREVSSRMSSDSCRTCRERKVKCDSERPSCKRCRAAGRVCKGYAIWQVELDRSSLVQQEDPQYAQLSLVTQEKISLPTSPSPAQTNRVQLLANFVMQNYSGERLASPPCAHTANMSFLHTLAESTVASPMLRVAIESLCLSHLANNTADRKLFSLPLQETYGRSLSLLRAAIVYSRTTRLSASHHRNVVAASVALSMLPSPCPARLVDGDCGRHAGLHLSGAWSYLHEHGPSILGERDLFEAPLFYHIHIQSVFTALTQRKRVEWTKAEWNKLKQLGPYPDPDFPTAMKYLPHEDFRGSVETTFVWCMLQKHGFMDAFTQALPGLLEKTDLFVAALAANTKPSSKRLLEREFTDLIKGLGGLQQAQYITPMSVNDTHVSPMLIDVCNDPCSFDDQIEEHVFLLKMPTPFPDFYQFTRIEHGFGCSLVHLLCLIADCAILQILHNASSRKLFEPEYSPLKIADIERRAFWHAAELCRCAYFYSRRSVTAGKFLHLLLLCAENFFECYGALQEREWCRQCINATKRRMERLGLKIPPTICPIGDLVVGMPEGCRFDRM